MTKVKVKANIAPAFEKGNHHLPANYKPISLTCVCAKLLEHIICKHMLIHFDRHSILTPLQHGFRAQHSCETQLLLASTDLVQNFENKLQTDVIVLDFSKAFDVVAHQRLLHNAAVNEFPDTPHRGAMWGICFLGVPKTQKSPQPGVHFMSKPPDNPQVKFPPNRVR